MTLTDLQLIAGCALAGVAVGLIVYVAALTVWDEWLDRQATPKWRELKRR